MDEHLESGRTVSEPRVSEQPGDERTSSSHTGGGEQMMELEARLEARIQDEVERSFQSAKDRRWSQLEKQYGMLSEQAAQPAARDKAAAGPGMLADEAEPAMPAANWGWRWLLNPLKAGSQSPPAGRRRNILVVLRRTQ